MEYTYKEMRAFAVDFTYYIHIKKLGDLSHEKHKELFDEWVKEKLPQAFVSGSLHYDEKLLIDLWYKRNPCHELNSNSGEDMFWKTAFMVFEDYVREVSRNDR